MQTYFVCPRDITDGAFLSFSCKCGAPPANKFASCRCTGNTFRVPRRTKEDVSFVYFMAKDTFIYLLLLLIGSFGCNLCAPTCQAAPLKTTAPDYDLFACAL